MAVRAAKTGRNLTMRLLPRTAGVSVAYIHEDVNGNNPNVPFDVLYTDTKLMVGDIHTNCFSDSKSWDHARKLCGVFAPDELAERVREHRKYVGTWIVPKEDSVSRDVSEEEYIYIYIYM